MARFVVVEIPDNVEADNFVKAVESGLVWYGTAEANEIKMTESAYRGWKVPQVYAVPTLFCECPDYEGKSTRSARYGWYVHAKCAKPRPGALQHPYNLLEKDVPATERVYYMGFRADRRPWRIPMAKQ